MENFWLHAKRNASVEVYALPSLALHRLFTPSFGPLFRHAVCGHRLYFANVGPTISEQTTLEVYDIPTGQLIEKKQVATVHKTPWPLIATPTELIDFGSGPQVITISSGKARKVMLDCDDMNGWEKMGGCWHNNTVFILCCKESGKLRVYESTLGNYSRTLRVPKHVKLKNFCRPAVVSLSADSVLIYSSWNPSAKGLKSEALLYNTKIHFAEFAGRMPGRPAAVLSHAVCQDTLYALLADGRALVCSLQTGIAKTFSLEDWNKVKGLLWAHKRILGILPLSLLKIIASEYLYGHALVAA